MQKRIIILLSGKISTGKSFISRGLRSNHQFEILSTKEALLSIAEKKNIAKSNRKRLQKLGSDLDRDTGGEWVVKELNSQIAGHERVVIDSVRIQGQIDAFRNHYGMAVIHIHCVAPDETRLKWFTERKRASDEFSNESEARQKFYEYAQDPTEKQVNTLQENADLVIHNEESIRPEDNNIRVASFLKLLPPTNSKNVDIVVGGQFGSEGKGQIAAYLAPDYDCLVRVGGPNAGHKVYNDPIDVFHIIPSGVSKNKEAKIILGPGTVINLETLLNEIAQFGLDASKLIIDPNCTIISEDDIRFEKANDKIGSTKQGVGRATSQNIIHRLNAQDCHKASKCAKLRPFINKASEALEEVHSRGGKILLEGTQGTFLSLHHGMYPHVTSRDTTVSGCLAEAGIGPKRVRKVIMVVRRYPIRVQNPEDGTSGDFNSAEISLEQISERSGQDLDYLKAIEKTTTTNRLRRIAEFNWALFRKACELNTPTDIAFTFSDYISVENQQARRYDQLSADTTKFIEELERCSGVPVSLIATRFHYRSIIDRRNWR